MLNDLGRPAGEGFETNLKGFVLPLDLDALIALRLPRTGERQAAFLGLVGAGFFDNNGVEHQHIVTLVVEGDDALVDADHIRCHADAARPVETQCVEKVLRCAAIVRRSCLGFLSEKGLVLADITNHSSPPVRSASGGAMI